MNICVNPMLTFNVTPKNSRERSLYEYELVIVVFTLFTVYKILEEYVTWLRILYLKVNGRQQSMRDY